MNFLRRCPRCGSPLIGIDLHPAHAPWICQECGIGWFASELVEEARVAYRSERHDFGRLTIQIRDNVRQELEASYARAAALREV